MFEAILEELPKNLSELIHYIIIYVIFRGIFSKWLAGKFVDVLFEPIVDFFKKRLIKTERDVAIWMHYKNKARHQGHNHNPHECRDGRCILL